MKIEKLEVSQHLDTRKLYEEVFSKDEKSFVDYYYQEKTTKFITGYENIDKEWDKYVAELENNIGLGRALEIAQKAYDRTNAVK